MPEHALLPAVQAALATVSDPEIRRPITELGMVDTLSIDADAVAHVRVLLTIAGCPLSGTIDSDVRAALANLPEGQRLALTLVDMHGLSIAEAAQILDVAEGTIKSRCARGRSALALVLQP